MSVLAGINDEERGGLCRMDKFKLTWNVYKNILKMDMAQMSLFCQELYYEGVSDGKKSTEGLGFEEIQDVLLSVRGIGEKRCAAIMSAFERRMSGENLSGVRKT